MADDIDIEEHNLLDNPRIKIIFPDITSIKTEVTDYEEYEEMTEESGRSALENVEEETVDYAMQEEMSNEEFEYVNNCNPEPIEYENDLPDLYPNKIILGSKQCSKSSTPSENYSEPSIQECSIVLQDFGPILDNSPYCSLCQTLFPTENALDSHKMTSHSFLVAVSNNKAKKSTSKSSISALEYIPIAPKVCNHCNETFPDDIALLKHSYDLIPEKIEDDIEVVACEEQSEENSNATYISCEICSYFFKYKGHYLAHMINCHGIASKELPIPVVTNLQCRFCQYVARNQKRYNKHICRCHSKLYTKKVKKDNSDQFKCDPCNISFLTAYSQKIHRALYHPDISKIRTHPSLEGKEDKINLFSTLRSYYSRPIPKSTLFSCDKCQIHFVSCLVACEHSKRCVLTKGDWKCAQCQRSFKMADREAHLKQHEVSDRLNVIKVQEGISDRILCRCLSCKICYDELNLLKYHSFGCSKVKSVVCRVCSVRMHKYAIKKHKRIHSELGPDQHFVIVDFIPDDKRTSKALPEEPKPRQRKFNAVYYYCSSCELYMKINRISHNHVTGNCNKFLPKCLCKFCGLRFTLKSCQSHEEVHRRLPNLKLSDIMFRNTQSGLKIDPPFPDFKKCKKCKVCFFSTVALRSHICYAEEVKICDYCGEKLSDLAYKLHVPFHEYRKQKKLVNELFKKYESLKSIWNILYLCVACDTVLDNYDHVVEHAQDHFCDMENYKVTINHCDICDLRFVGESFRRHEYLHAGDISKSSFDIIKFNHETLLSDKWLDIFTTLDPEQVDQILKKSIYKDTRSVRMTVLDSKDSEFRLYQCGVCNVMVESNKIIDHTHNRINCDKTINISCNLCQFRFDSKNALISHLGLHENLQIDAMAFKIISFNNEKDAFVNAKFKSVMNPEALKFIRCLHCKKLIKKEKYNKHVIYHRYLNKKKQEKMKKPKFVVRPKFKNTAIAPNLFYKCKLCGVCVLKQTIKIHYCSEKNHKKQCKKCLLWFRANNFQKHELYHKKYKFTTGVNVVSFKNGVIESNTLESYCMESNTVLYQCTECKACLHYKHNIPKHKCLSSKNLRQCNLCEVSFHSSHFNIHEKLHDTKSFSKEDVIITKFTPPSNVESLKKALVPVKLKNNEATRFSKETSVKKQTVSKEFTRDFENGDETNFELTENDFKRLYCRVFRCDKCQVLFLTGSALYEHAKCCDEDRESVKCKCGLLFHSSALELHQKWQRCGKSGLTKYFVVTLISENIADFDLRKCLYTCRECDIYYLSLATITKHLEQNHLEVRTLVKCKQCNLPFSLISNTKHNRLHHKKHNWSISDLHIFEVKYITMAQTTNDFPEDSVCDESFVSAANDTSSKKKSVQKEHAEKPVVANRVWKIGPKTVSKILKRNFKNGNRTNFELTDKNYIKCLYCRVFKCEKCQVLFLTGSALLKHAKCCDEDRDSVKCECGLLFHPSALKFHQIWQRCGQSEITKYYVFTLISENIVDFDLRKCLYTCRTCDVYYINIHTVSKHFEDNHLAVNTLVQCEQCNLRFSLISNAKHNKLHHNKHNWSISDLHIFEVKYITSAQIMNDFPEDSTRNESFASTANDPSSERKLMKRKHAEEPVVANKVLKIGLKPVSEELTRNLQNGDGTDIELIDKNSIRYMYCRLFKCEKCKVLFLTAFALVQHAKCCDEDRDSIKCKCGLLFHSSALELHEKWQRCGKSGETECYIVTLISENIVDFDHRKCLYTCRECNIYFLTFTTATAHYELQRHVINSMLYKCEQCNIDFTGISLSRHNKLHHETQNWSLSDLNIFEIKYMTMTQIMNDFPEDSVYYDESFTSTANESSSEKKSVNRTHVEEPVVANKVLQKGQSTWSWSGTCDMTNIYTCNICDISFLHNKTLANHCYVGRHKEHRMKCICGHSFTGKSLRRHLDAPSDVPLSELEKLITSFKKDELNECHNDKVTVKTGNNLKLFKCSVCDVYFLTDEVCQDHITNHQVLDPTEYIACKICELQFLCEYLGAHMKTHRDKTFNIEDVMVTELQPGEGTEDTYRAIDRLKSKAVSTTTYFDAEDEKSESVVSSNQLGD